MNNDIGNTLLKCCGEPEMPDIPGAALQSIINDAYKPDCDDRYEALQRQVEALEEHNANQARTISNLEFEIRELRERLNGREFG